MVASLKGISMVKGEKRGGLKDSMGLGACSGRKEELSRSPRQLMVAASWQEWLLLKYVFNTLGKTS